MRISELIESLKRIKQERGDLYVLKKLPFDAQRPNETRLGFLTEEVSVVEVSEFDLEHDPVVKDFNPGSFQHQWDRVRVVNIG